MPVECVLRPYVQYFAAPPGLRDRVRRALRDATPATAPTRKPRVRWSTPQWLKLGAVSFATAMITATLLLPMRAMVADAAIADVLIASHVRSNRLDKLIDVATSDRHTVKPWLSQKLGYSPAVPDLRADGFNLIGGRIDYVDDRFVGAVVYKRREHVIDVYAWPGAKGTEAPHSISRNGLHAIRWSVGDMTYWAVSDLNVDELRQFVDLYAHET